MKLVAVQRVIYVVSPLGQVALQAAAKLHMILGFDENLQVEFLLYLFKVLDKQSLHYNDGCGREHQLARNRLRVVERVFKLLYLLAFLEPDKVIMKQRLIDCNREIKVD